MAFQQAPPAGHTDIDWRDLRALVEELADRAREPLSPTDFFRELLIRIQPALAAPAGLAWTCNEQGKLQPLCPAFC